MEPVKINPNFDNLKPPTRQSLDKAETIINGVNKLLEKEKPTPHSKILEKLKQAVHPVDFEKQANPHNTEGFKIGSKHYRQLVIENLIRIALKNRWGICKKHGFIYVFNGAFWAVVDEGEFKKFLRDVAVNMGVPRFTAKDCYFVDQLYKQFLLDAFLNTPEPDVDTVLVNLKNGTFEVTPKDKKLRPFDSDDFLTYLLHFEHDPQAKAPKFQEYLNRVLPDRQCQKVLAEYIGYLFIRNGGSSLKLEKALLLYGTGANGKSVFFEVINALLGEDNISTYSLQSLTDSTGYYRAKLANKLANYASEINGKLETSIFKQLVSGEPVEARQPYGQPFHIRNYGKLIFNSNELPKEVEHTEAFFRRFLIIPFDVTIPEDEQDRNLHKNIINNELSGVLNWVLEGLNRLLEQQSFSECDASRKAVLKYRKESDSVLLFLDDQGYRVSTSIETRLKEIFTGYQQYCKDNGFRACSSRTFADRLRSVGYHTERKNYGMCVFAERETGTITSPPFK